MCKVHFMRAVLKNIPKKDNKKVAYMLMDSLEDEGKMQQLAVILDEKGYKMSAEAIDKSRFDLWNYRSFPRQHWKRSEPLTA